MEAIRENKKKIENRIAELIIESRIAESRNYKIRFRRECEERRIVQRYIKDFCESNNLHLEDGTGRIFLFKNKPYRPSYADDEYFINRYLIEPYSFNNSILISFYFSNDKLISDMKTFKLLDSENYNAFIMYSELFIQYVKIVKEHENAMLEEYKTLTKKYKKLLQPIIKLQKDISSEHKELKEKLKQIEYDLFIQPGYSYKNRHNNYLIIDSIKNDNVNYYYVDSLEDVEKGLKEIKKNGEPPTHIHDKDEFFNHIMDKEYKPIKSTERKIKIRRLIYE